MKRSKFKVTKKAMRPASVEEKCFYCGKRVGDFHESDCIFIKKKVLIKAVVTYEVEVPSDWKKADVDFHRNESSWCANNFIDELKKLSDKNGCICGNTNFKYLKTASKSFLKEA